MSLAVTPAQDARDVLPGAQFADAYRTGVGGAAINARSAAERMMARTPAWVGRLMAIRNAIMAPFGVRAPKWQGRSSAAAIGIFPVVSEAPGRLVAGFDDVHLDFRLVVDVEGGFVTTTTVVRTHNVLGRGYLAAIMPFHRLIVQQMLRQVAAP
jgi:hypothetical protein